MVVALAAVAAASLFVGSAGGFDPEIVLRLRLPRVILGVLVGGALASSGAVYQNILRNPLADPYILGSASGAALGVAMAEAFGARYMAPLFSFVFSFAATAFVFAAANGFGRGVSASPSSGRLILVGVAVNVFISGAIILFYYVSARDAHTLVMFLFGNLQENNPRLIAVAALASAPCIWLLVKSAPSLDTFALGEEKSATIGTNVAGRRLAAAALVSVLTGVSVSLAGVIGFVGLVAPHAARIFVGPSLKKLIPSAFVVGAIYLVISDAAARSLFAPVELPVGVVSAILGAPYFIYILSRGE